MKRLDTPVGALAVTILVSAISAWMVFGRAFANPLHGQIAGAVFVLAVTIPLNWRDLVASINEVPIGRFINYAGLIFFAFMAGRIVLHLFGVETISLPIGRALDHSPILTAIAYSVVGPISEEMLFRGYLFPRLLSFGLAPAALVSTAIWTSLHFKFPAPSIAVIFCTGLVMCWVMKRTGSVWVTTAGHMLINAPIAIFYLFMNG